jgi:ketosteroid isomerase-like protein
MRIVMNYTSLISITISGVFLSACSQSNVDVEAELESLRAAADTYHQLAHSAEFASMVNSDANNVLILPPNATAINGFVEAKAFFAATPDIEISYGDIKAGVAASGEMGYSITDAVIKAEGPDGNLVEDRIRDFHLWKKQDGEWKIAIDIWNSEIPLAGAVE